MIRFILLGLTFSFFASSFGRELEKVRPEVLLESSRTDAKLKSGESVYEFEFFGFMTQRTSYFIDYSIDGENHRAQLNADRILRVETTPGKHKFQFYYNSSYQEIYTDYLEIKDRHLDVYSVYLTYSEMPVMTEKPVIYLYPESAIDVNVSLDFKGKNPFFYPAYNNGWKVHAQPNGDLTVDGKQYNYLFWEASQNIPYAKSQMTEGFFVKGEEAVAFLEEKLTNAGLNSKEQADFITYWGPRLAANHLNFVHFKFNDDCNAYAKLNIEPQPEETYRIYMIWSAVSDYHPVSPQNIPTVKRNGFTVLEWGGRQVYFEELLTRYPIKN